MFVRSFSAEALITVVGEDAAAPAEAAAAPAPEVREKRVFKKKFVKKTVTVQDADIKVGNGYTGRVVRCPLRLPPPDAGMGHGLTGMGGSGS
jgi:hypothetical protein